MNNLLKTKQNDNKQKPTITTTTIWKINKNDALDVVNRETKRRSNLAHIKFKKKNKKPQINIINWKYNTYGWYERSNEVSHMEMLEQNVPAHSEHIYRSNDIHNGEYDGNDQFNLQP